MEISSNGQVLAIFAKKLTSNDQTIRTRNLKKLRNLLRKLTDDVSELSLLHLCKGLHYVLWMSDKALAQEQLADELAGIIHILPSKNLSIRYFDAFLKILRKEWHMIDTFRQDKFLRLNRFMIRQMLQWLKNNQWESEFVVQFCKSIERCFVSKEGASTDLFYMVESVLPEINKVSEGELPDELIKNLCDAFIEILSRINSKYLAKAIKTSIFTELKGDTYKIDASIYQAKVIEVASKNNIKNRAILFSLIK